MKGASFPSCLVSFLLCRVWSPMGLHPRRCGYLLNFFSPISESEVLQWPVLTAVAIPPPCSQRPRQPYCELGPHPDPAPVATPPLMIYLLILLLFLFRYGRAQQKFFPPAIPLAVRSPYLSCWDHMASWPDQGSLWPTTSDPNQVCCLPFAGRGN